MIKKYLVFCIFIIVFSLDFWAKSYEFIDQDIEEVLFVLSMEENLTIIGDDTVKGRVNFRGIGDDFSEIFDLFLAQNRLYVYKNERVWLVSKIRVFCDDENFVQVDAFDISSQRLFESLTAVSGMPIVYDLLPTQNVSLHVSNISVKDCVELILASLGSFQVFEEEHCIRIRKEIHQDFNPANYGYCRIEKFENNEFFETENLYTAEISQAQGKVVLETLCELAQVEAVFLTTSLNQIDTIKLKGKSFQELLDLFCMQLSLTAIEKDSVLYFIEGRDSLYNTKNFGKTWELYCLEYIRSQECSSFLQNRFENLRIYTIFSKLFILAQESIHQEIKILLKTIDCPEILHIVALDYIKSEDFLSLLPPGFSEDEFYKTGTEGSLFFLGTDKKYKQLLSLLENIDLPQKQILYDLLVLQVQESNSFSWEPSLTAKTISLGDRNFVSADLGSVMDLQFNVLSAFGLDFAIKLQTAINESKAKIFADTSLHGLSGVPINFQNTNTYRYKDMAINPETGKPMYTGVTREIVSGLFLEVEGWVSGNGMITTKVKATVSKRGADVSSSVGNPPPTYEKIITTEVRSKSGEMVILSGLIQDDSVLIEQRDPLISKIPLIGKFFSSLVNTREKTEMLIYLIPKLIRDDDGDDESQAVAKNTEQEKMNELSQKVYQFLKENKNGI